MHAHVLSSLPNAGSATMDLIGGGGGGGGAGMQLEIKNTNNDKYFKHRGYDNIKYCAPAHGGAGGGAMELEA